MVVVAPDSTLRRVEVLAFGEPLDYIPADVFYAQYRGKRLDEKLHLKRGVRNVTGATLTAQATTDAARRTLALHALVYGPAPAAATRVAHNK